MSEIRAVADPLAAALANYEDYLVSGVGPQRAADVRECMAGAIQFIREAAYVAGEVPRPAGETPMVLRGER